MTVIVNNPAATESEQSSGMGFLVGGVLLLAFLFLMFYYGLPALRSASSGTQVNVPDKIDVNVNNPSK